MKELDALASEYRSSRPNIDLSQAGNRDFKPGRHAAIIALWMLLEFLLVTNPIQPSSAVRAWTLRLFGAKIGLGAILRPRIRVKFPWRLHVGDHCWIGEGAWIHNQGHVYLGDHSVISQEAFITTGSHDAQKTMDLLVEPVLIGRGAWITSRCIVMQGVVVGENAVVLPGSVVSRSLPADGIYGGMPARLIKNRWSS